MKIGITGASGMLGTALVANLSKTYEVFATSRSQGIKGKNIKWNCFDITNRALLVRWLNKCKPDIVIHCAAIINIDACEHDIDLATKVHIKATDTLVEYLNNNNGRLIYISTDSVFDGKKQTPYSEVDIPNPINIYAKTKLMGEKPVRLMHKGLILRTNIIGQIQGERSSFFEWILQSLINKEPLNLFYDVYFSPITVYDLSSLVRKIIEEPIFGLYHCGSNDGISKYDFGMKVAKIFKLSNLNINKVSINSMNFKAKRPKNMSLNIKKISSDMDYEFPSVVDVIETMKRQYSDK